MNVKSVSPIISGYQSKLKSVGKLSPRSVSNLSDELRQSVRDCTPKRLKELAQMNCYAADKIKSVLDAQYGEGKYVLIAIGRSISSIAELIGHMGADVKIIPLSDLRKADIDSISPKGLQAYKFFLDIIGISKKALKKNKNKTYILMDYTYYGRSLEKTEKLLKRDDMLGDAPNLISMPVSNVLGEDYEKRGFKKLFEYCRFKDYSRVGKLPISQLERVFQQSSPDKLPEFSGNITKGLRNLFWFNVFDSYCRNNYKDIMPNLELHSLYKHYLSPKAINNYIYREMQKNNKVIDSLK